ncbi:MAG: type II toxin-antitoxin system RelE/ParE family toxin [Gammaproteobacteria bacterium]|nr:type II toxin-antitoxin system RelE/ParE family toxin [Gammaproteobacteria bacterium]MBU1447904.1 type II toxin-antitoxin system RelE/ParE family toxin [Gammaproteobacteria bacterium]
MSYKVRYTEAAREDLKRLFTFQADQDRRAAQNARKAIADSIKLLQEFPFTCRKAIPENPLLREMLVSFGAAGYVALFEIEDNNTVTILAVRHQREDDYY